MATHIESIMTTGITCATPDYSLSELEALMDKHGILCVPIIQEDGKCIGVVSAQDLLHWRFARQRFVEIKAKDILELPFVPVELASSTEEAIELMLSKNAHHLVVQNNGQLVGILSAMDLLQNIFQEKRAIESWR